MQLHLFKAIISLLLIVHIKDLKSQSLFSGDTLMSLSATHSPSVFLWALNTYENFPWPLFDIIYLRNTNEFDDLEAVDLLADEVLNLDCSSGACHDYIIQIY